MGYQGRTATGKEPFAMILRTCTMLCLLTAPAAADVWSFATPSGNIECWVGEEAGSSDIDCTILSRSKPASVPGLESCPLGQGIGFRMADTGPVTATCLAPGHRHSGGQHVADYGVTGQFGGFVCRSSTAGLECRNQSGRGFFLSRALQRAF
ncbi:DUF6636 domain-containing protein [Marimonas sp. MJW-29]|uniref:DUF6636 domain-containing protein n=1 Tax=Sulfitobacter sediminis TaxID=3234186 RepID=A0ABV3RV27_9RHOB